MRAAWYAVFVLLAAATTSAAQFGSSGGGVDLAPYAKKTDVPTPLGAVPPSPAGSGSAGDPGTYVSGTAAQKQTVQRTTVLLDSSGNWAVTWGVPFVSSSPTVNPIALNTGATTPMVCNVTSRSSTAAAGKCWQTTSQTVALISLTISLSATNAPTSTPIMVIGAEPTQ